MFSLNARLGIIFFTALLARIVYFHFTGFVNDDAFITFRYAENLAHGLGFVYNAGQPVLGTSSPLFTLILACLAIVGFKIPSAALAISLIASGLTAAVIYRFAWHLRFTLFAWLPTIAYILWPRSLTADTAGMETALFTLLVTAAFYYEAKQLRFYSLGVATLSALTRPEGYLVLGILLLINLYREPRFWKQQLSVVGLLLLPWLIFATIYFGSPIPNTVLAKAQLLDKLGHFSIWETVRYFMAWHSPFGWLMTLMAIPGGYWLNKKQNFGWPAIIFLVGLIGFYAFTSARMFFWYVTPIYPLYFIFALASLCWVADRFGWVKQHRELVRNLGLIALIILFCYAWITPVDYYARLQESQLKAQYEVGTYLSAKASADALVAAEDIGYIGFYSGKRILDRDGLVSPEVIPYNRTRNYLGLITDFQPDWVVTLRGSRLSGFYNQQEFTKQYRLATSYESERVSYDIFRHVIPDSTQSIENLQPQK